MYADMMNVVFSISVVKHKTNGIPRSDLIHSHNSLIQFIEAYYKFVFCISAMMNGLALSEHILYAESSSSFVLNLSFFY